MSIEISVFELHEEYPIFEETFNSRFEAYQYISNYFNLKFDSIDQVIDDLDQDSIIIIETF